MKISYKLNVISYKLLFALIIYNSSFITHNCFSQTNPHQLYHDALVKDSLKDFDGALSDLDKAIALMSNNDTLHVLHAKVEAETNHSQEAFAEVNEIIKHNHTYFDAYMLRGILKAKSGNYEGALVDFNKCLKLNPKSAKAFYNRGLAHAYMDEVKQALKDFSSSTDLDATNANAWFQKGYWKEIMGDLNGSLTDLNKAKELNPNDKELYVSLAITNFKLNNKTAACTYITEAKNRGSSTADELILLICK
jgi:tetratricopeptide (TPR) repeat protein